MLKLSLGILFIVALFEPTIQQYSDEYCAKYVATFPLTMEVCIDNIDNSLFGYGADLMINPPRINKRPACVDDHSA